MANEIERRYGTKRLHGLSAMPVGIMTGLQVRIPDDVKEGRSKNEEIGSYMKSPEQGASTTIYATLSKDWEGKGGNYLEDCDVAEESTSNSQLALGHAPHAYNEQGEKRLWVDSLKFVGWKDDE